MPLDVWLAFVVACAVLLAIPGPTIMLVAGYALAGGRRTALATVPGVALGDLTAMTLSLAGLGAVLATSATLFAAVKWAGAAYLVYLGVRLWRAPAVAPAADAPPRAARAMFAHAFAVTVLNPKGIVFFVAFLPQFLNPSLPLPPQMAVAVLTFVTLAVVNAAAYGLLAGGVRAAVRRPGVLRAVNRVGGGILVGAGAMTAAARSH